MLYNKYLSLALISALSSLSASNELRLDEIAVSSNSMGVDESKISIRNASLVKDVLRDIPGVYVGGTNGANQKIYIRGISDRGLNITIDGARQVGNTFHHNADLIIDPDLIRVVDVDVGGLSVANAGGNLGGGVAFKTINAKDFLDSDGFGAKLKLGYASNNQAISENAIFYGLKSGFDVLLSLKNQNYKRGVAGNSKQIGGKGNDLSGLFKLGYDFGDTQNLGLSLEGLSFAGDYPFRAEFGSRDDLKNTSYSRLTATMSYLNKFSDSSELDAKIYYTNHFREQKDSAKWGIKTRGASLEARSVLEYDNITQSLKYGLSSYNAINNSSTSNLRSESSVTTALYAEDVLRFQGALKGLFIRPAVRFEMHGLSSYGNENKNIRYNFNGVIPALAGEYSFGDSGFKLFASYAGIFKGPDVAEALYASGNIRNKEIKYASNDELKPTTGYSYEAGAGYSLNYFDTAILGVNAKFFDTYYNDLIVENYALKDGKIMRKNAGNARVYGLELALRARVHNLSLSTSYSHQKSKYKDRLIRSTNEDGINTYYIPNLLAYKDQGDKYVFNAEYSISSMDTLLGYNLVAFASANTASASSDALIELPSYSVSDVYLTYAPLSGDLKGLEINFGIYNIFNKAYASHSQRAELFTGENDTIDWEAGRNVKINVSYKF